MEAIRSIAGKLNVFRSLQNDEGNAENIVRDAYKTILRRNPDPGGLVHYAEKLRSGLISKEQLIDALVSSLEFRKNIQFGSMQTAIHASREFYVQSLPEASIIVDLGGSSQGNASGALVTMGYPYKFKRLTIIDLPLEKRHQIYANCENIDFYESPNGPVHYLYQSMTELGNFENGSVDMVYSGQTIEHITEDECDLMLKEIRRILRPGGYFCLDTPNGVVTRLQQEEFIDPDHKIEYSHSHLSQKLVDAGFVIREAKGLGLMQNAYDRGAFDESEIISNPGIFSCIEKCYLLTYICENP